MADLIIEDVDGDTISVMRAGDKTLWIRFGRPSEGNVSMSTMFDGDNEQHLGDLRKLCDHIEEFIKKNLK